MLKPTLESLPVRLQGLPIDERGYPVPWFVAWENGKPEFRAMDPLKFWREDDVINNSALRDNAAGFAIARNPGVAMILATRQYEVFKALNGVLIQMREKEYKEKERKAA
jgi:hypothetical protein